MKTLQLIALISLLAYITTGCNSTDQNKEVGGSTDSSSVNKAGGPPITDTNTINQVRKQQLQDSVKGDTTHRGNAAPDGHTPEK